MCYRGDQLYLGVGFEGDNNWVFCDQGGSMMQKKLKGFTLIELLIAIVIIAILAAVLMPAIIGYVAKSEDTKNETNCSSLYSQASQELFSDQSLSIGDSKDEPSANTGDMEITYIIDGPSKTLSVFVCKKGTWTYTLK